MHQKIKIRYLFMGLIVTSIFSILSIILKLNYIVINKKQHFIFMQYDIKSSYLNSYWNYKHRNSYEIDEEKNNMEHIYETDTDNFYKQDDEVNQYDLSDNNIEHVSNNKLNYKMNKLRNRDKQVINVSLTLQRKNNNAMNLSNYEGKLDDTYLNDSKESLNKLPFIFIKNETMYPDSTVYNTTIISDNLKTIATLVFSTRDHFQERHTIRNTWATKAKNVYFFIGKYFCEIPLQYRIDYTCDRNTSKGEIGTAQLNHHLRYENYVENKLEEESRKYKDLILVSVVDTYRSLPRKLKLAYAWAVDNTDAKWFLKVC